MSIPLDGGYQNTELRANGRLWNAGHFIPNEVGSGFSADAPVACPNRKYVFVKPRSSYSVSEFVLTRDQFFSTGGTHSTIAGFTFWLGDASSCGGTVITHDRSNPAQAFLHNPSTQSAFDSEQIAIGGFFLLGNRQGAGAAATEIKKIVFDCNLDYLVLACHQAGADPEFSAVGLRHLIAAIRWDFGFRKPILLMMGDGSPTVHLMKVNDVFNNEELGFQSSSDVSPTSLVVPPATLEENDQEYPGTPLLVGDITAQEDIAYSNVRAAELHVLDRAGYLGLNWWPIVAFVPNSLGGIDPGLSVLLMGLNNIPANSVSGRAFYHPLLVPEGGSGCPFNTNRGLSASELNHAESVFETTAPYPFVRNRTTSAWFWDYDTVRNSARVRSWTVPSGRLTAESDNLEYMSDVTAVWESKPRWVSHPIMGQDYAMMFSLIGRGDSQVIWNERSGDFGNIPWLMGAGDLEDGWLTTVTPFEVSPTARDYREYKTMVPLLPGWVKFNWKSEVEGGDEGDHMTPRVCPDGVTPCHDWSNLDRDCTDNWSKKWNGGKNQARVVMYGKLCDSCVRELGTSAFLDLACAPFSFNIQVRNIYAGRTRDNGEPSGLVWPSRLFYVAPIRVANDIPGLTYWSTLPVDFNGKFNNAVGTPISIDLTQQENANASHGLIPTAFLTIFDVLTDKGDFPPMVDTYDPFLQRGFHNHLSRVDIAPVRVSRVAEHGGGGGGGGGGWAGCQGIESLEWRWPVQDDKPIEITNSFTSAGTHGEDHCAIDITYAPPHNIDGEQVNAAAGGVVSTVGYQGAGCGHYVVLRHTIQASGRQVYSQYCHLREGSISVEDGETVQRGEKLGNVGNSGYSSGPHLHFAIHCDQAGSEATCGLSGVNPCALLPEPTAGYGPNSQTCEPADASVEDMLCRMWDEVVGDATMVCNDGAVRRIKDVALAVARCESGLNECSTGSCLSIGGIPHSAMGLFQILNPLHITSDVLAGNIDGSHTETPVRDCNDRIWCAGLRGNTDYFQAEANIKAALRIYSGGGFHPWSCYFCGPPECSQARSPYLSKLNPPCAN